MGVFHIDEIRHIERIKVVKNPEWYYHGFDYKENDFIDMITSGIKCPFLIHKEGIGYNGRFFISLSKDINAQEMSAFHDFLGTNPMLIIEKIKPLKCYPLKSNPIPFFTRESDWNDEYQAFFVIPAKKIVGIQSTIEKWAMRDKIDYLKEVRKIITTLNDIGLDLPIYDYSHYEEGTIYEVDKQGYLDLSKKLI